MNINTIYFRSQEYIRKINLAINWRFNYINNLNNFEIYNKYLAMTPQHLPRSLTQIICYIPNMITGFRLILNYAALLLFHEFPELSCLLVMISVILDYVDGYTARKYNQCSFFGDIFDWIVDVSSSAAVYFWWGSYEPRYIFIVFTLMTLEIISMVIDIIAKSHGYTPMVKDNNWATLILKYTMTPNKRGASYVGLGYWNQILHYFCILSRVMFLSTSLDYWNYLFYMSLPASLSYVWMNVAYAKNIADCWHETYQNNQAKVHFIEEN